MYKGSAEKAAALQRMREFGRLGDAIAQNLIPPAVADEPHNWVIGSCIDDKRPLRARPPRMRIRASTRNLMQRKAHRTPRYW